MTRPNENWEGREFISLGPKFRIDTANPQMGLDGSVVYMLYAVTDNKEQHLCALSEGGTYHIHNDGKIEMIGGLNRQAGGVDVQISTKKGDITITANENGQVRIKGSSIEIKADSDIDLKAGRNINLNAGARILLNANKVDAKGLLGNVIEKTSGSFIQRVFSPTKVGSDFLANPDIGALSGIGDLANITENLPINDIQSQLSSVDLGGLTIKKQSAAQSLPSNINLPSGFNFPV